MKIPADQNFATTRSAGGIELRAIQDSDAFARNLNMPAGVAGAAIRRVDRAADEYVPAALPLQAHVAAGKFAVLRDGHGVKVARGQQHRALAGVDLAAVAHPGASRRSARGRRAARLDVNIAAVLAEQHLVAGREADETVWRND